MVRSACASAREAKADRSNSASFAYYPAALIFQHGETVKEIWSAHQVALGSVEMGIPMGKWLAAAWDR